MLDSQYQLDYVRPTHHLPVIDFRNAGYTFVYFHALRASQSAPITILDAGERQRTQSQTSEAAKGSALLDEMLSSLLLALESRLKKSKLAIIQIFVVMMSSEAESTAIISSLQEMKFDMEAFCSEDVQVPSAEAESRRLSSAHVPSAAAKSRRLSSAQVLSAEAKSRRLSRAQA
jgi:hypothetical protein